MSQNLSQTENTKVTSQTTSPGTATATSTSTITTRPFTSGLKNYWPFNGNFIDIVSGKNMILNSPSATFTTGISQKFNKALDLDRGFVRAPDGIYFSGDFTISAWIMLRNYSENVTIFDFGNSAFEDNVYIRLCGANRQQGVMFAINSPQPPDFQFQSATTFAAAPLYLNQWYFLTAVTKFSHVNNNISLFETMIYYNATFQDKRTGRGPRDVRRIYNYIGKTYWDTSYANAKIDELKIFDRALNQTEISNEYLNFP